MTRMDLMPRAALCPVVSFQMRQLVRSASVSLARRGTTLRSRSRILLSLLATRFSSTRIRSRSTTTECVFCMTPYRRRRREQLSSEQGPADETTSNEVSVQMGFR